MMAMVDKIGVARPTLPLMTAADRAFSRFMPLVNTRHATSCGSITDVAGSVGESSNRVHASAVLCTYHTPPASPEISKHTDVPGGAGVFRNVYGNARTNVSRTGRRKYGS